MTRCFVFMIDFERVLSAAFFQVFLIEGVQDEIVKSVLGTYLKIL